MTASSTFTKNWLLTLTGKLNDRPTAKSWTTALRSGLRHSLKLGGGLLLWTLLVLPVKAAVEMRVGLMAEGDRITIGTSTTGIIRDGNGAALYQLPELQGITIEADDYDVDLTNGVSLLAESSAFWLEPSEGGFVWIGDKWYRGRVQVTLNEGELVAVNHVDLEDYLYSVVGSEMPTSWPQAALQSQAIAARSYALYKRSRNTNPLFDLGGTTTHQVYKGLEQEHPNTITAVDTTENQVVTYNGQVIEAIFHSSSGGGTENAGDVWSSDVPYLRSVEDFDHNSPVFTWEETFSLDEFSSRIGDIGRIYSVSEPQRTNSGRVANITFNGDNGSQTLRGRDVRSALRLRSTRFDIDISDSSVVVRGSGFGHGVGMSQWGARSLAEQGWNYEQILQHYYQNTAIAQLEG